MRFLFSLLAVWLTLHTVLGAPILTDLFDSGVGSWIPSGDVVSVTSPRLGSVGQSVRLKGAAQIWKIIPTTGYASISISANLAASSLEGGSDKCVVEYSTNNGASYTTFLQLADGQDNNVFFAGNANLPASAQNNAVFAVRYRGANDAAGDYCYCETLTVSGTAQTFPPPGAPVLITSFQDLTGSGVVSRTALTYTQLTSGGAISRVDLSAFALPATAAQPTNYFQAPLNSLNEGIVGSFQSIRDDYSYLSTPERIHLPKMYHEFIQHGSHIIPAIRTYQLSGHPTWEYIFSPGRVWNENSDNGMTRAAIPFAITQRNANCVHNGVMTFLFKTAVDGTMLSMSGMYYQISQETCAYFKVDLWGVISVSAVTATNVNALALRNAYVAEVGARYTTFPMAQLKIDYPAVDLTKYGAGVTAGHMTAYGYEIDGKHYTGGYSTRNGQYPYPDVMVFPSYSTSKSFFTSMAAMRFNQKYPSQNLYTSSVYSKLSTYPNNPCTSAGWNDVSIANVLDMATSHYSLAGYQADEGSTATSNGYFLQETQAARLAFACGLPRKAQAPGTFWNYHTTDNHIAATAIQMAIQSQEPGVTIGQFLTNEIFVPLKLSPMTYGPKLSYDTTAQAWGAYGEFIYGDDYAKISNFMNEAQGKIGATQILDYARLKMALQRDAANTGLAVTVPNQNPVYNHKYKYNFWSKDMYGGLYAGCTVNQYTPYMSGYGGISVVLLKNKSNYYAVSDNSEYEGWISAVTDSTAHIRSPCAAGSTYT